MISLILAGWFAFIIPSDFPSEFYTGDTDQVESSQFLFLSPITKEDLKQVEMSQAEARKEGYISRKSQWIRSSL